MSVIKRSIAVRRANMTPYFALLVNGLERGSVRSGLVLQNGELELQVGAWLGFRGRNRSSPPDWHGSSRLLVSLVPSVFCEESKPNTDDDRWWPTRHPGGHKLCHRKEIWNLSAPR